MRVLLRVDKIEPNGSFSVFYGVVQNEAILVGQEVIAVSRGGQRDPALLTAIMPDHAGLKEFDRGPVGKAVKLTLRRRQPSFPDAELAHLEEAVRA